MEGLGKGWGREGKGWEGKGGEGRKRRIKETNCRIRSVFCTCVEVVVVIVYFVVVVKFC